MEFSDKDLKVIEDLPASQREGLGRHRCACCAYNKGYNQAWEDATRAIGHRRTTGRN